MSRRGLIIELWTFYDAVEINPDTATYTTNARNRRPDDKRNTRSNSIDTQHTNTHILSTNVEFRRSSFRGACFRENV